MQKTYLRHYVKKVAKKAKLVQSLVIEVIRK